MKYFTPKLYVAYGSEDTSVWKEAGDRWEEACERYTAYLETIKERFPPGLRHIGESYYLHDSTVQGMDTREGAFLIVLRLDTPQRSLLTFTYVLASLPGARRRDCAFGFSWGTTAW